MISWREFVREVQKKNKISYKEAMTKASALWKKKPNSEKKTKSKGPKGIDKVPEISQFPIKMRFSKKKSNQRKVPDILSRNHTKRKRSLNVGPIDENRFKYLQVGTDYVKV